LPALACTILPRFACGRRESVSNRGLACGVICFEWLQRTENVLAGFVRWTDYRPPEKSTFLRIEHARTGEVVWHPLEDAEGNLLYPEAESVLVPRRGVPMILRRTPSGTFKPYNAMEMARVIRRVRAAAALPD
jgi:hypothetical protein